jgi:hydrogenase expression/formation protein HypC
MCLGVPQEVLEVTGPEEVLVRVGSGVQHCFTGLLDDVRVGDWVVVHAGLAVEKITEADARENLRLINTWVTGEEAPTDEKEAASPTT